jgi:hypothetical protein
MRFHMKKEARITNTTKMSGAPTAEQSCTTSTVGGLWPVTDRAAAAARKWSMLAALLVLGTRACFPSAMAHRIMS